VRVPQHPQRLSAAVLSRAAPPQTFVIRAGHNDHRSFWLMPRICKYISPNGLGSSGACPASSQPAISHINAASAAVCLQSRRMHAVRTPLLFETTSASSSTAYPHVLPYCPLHCPPRPRTPLSQAVQFNLMATCHWQQLSFLSFR
jgi:hypothetical protein